MFRERKNWQKIFMVIGWKKEGYRRKAKTHLFLREDEPFEKHLIYSFIDWFIDSSKNTRVNFQVFLECAHVTFLTNAGSCVIGWPFPCNLALTLPLFCTFYSEFGGKGHPSIYVIYFTHNNQTKWTQSLTMRKMMNTTTVPFLS